MTDDQAIIAMVENELGVSTIPELVLQGMSHKVRVLNLEPEQHRITTKKFIEYVKKLLGSNLV